MPSPPCRVYLAGDLVFRHDAQALFDRLRGLCRAAGLQPVVPFDGQEAVRGLPPGAATSLAIARADRDLMDGCDAGLFCLDPFRRGADMDPGTAVEIGYMAAQGKPLAGYTIDGRFYPEKVAAYMRAAWGCALRPRPAPPEEASSGAMEDADGVLVHSQGFMQNAMTEGLIRLSGGSVCVGHDLFDAFAQAAALLAVACGLLVRPAP